MYYTAKEVGNVVVHFTKNNIPVLVEILEASSFVSQAENIIHRENKGTDEKTVPASVLWPFLEQLMSF